MKGTNSKYFLSFDFRIFYCPDTFLVGAYKELNFDTLKFEPYLANKDIVQYAHPIDVSEINSIVKSILLGKISYMLSEQNMTWIKEFEAQANADPELWENDKYMFNYLVLKTMLMGFSQSNALNIMKSYFKYKRNGQPVLPLKQVIKSINKAISNKEFWITNRVHEFESKEVAFLEKVLTNKIQTGFRFDYRFFERDYMGICNNSFSKENYILNSSQRYPIKKPKKLQDQVPYLMDAYETVIIAIINALIENKYSKLQSETKFLTNLINDMKDTLSITMTTWEL